MIRLERRHATIILSLLLLSSCSSKTTELNISNNSEIPINTFVITINDKEINIGEIPANSTVVQNINAISVDSYTAKSYFNVTCKWKRPDVVGAYANEHVKSKSPLKSHLQKMYIFINSDNKMICSLNDDNKEDLKEVENTYSAFRAAAGDLLNNVTNTAKRCMSDANVNLSDKDLFATYWDNAKLWNIVINRPEDIEGNKITQRSMYKDRLSILLDQSSGINSTLNKTFDGYYMVTGYTSKDKLNPLYIARRKLVPDPSDKVNKAVDVCIMIKK